MENNVLKWYGHILLTGDNKWPKRILTWSREGTKRKGRVQIKWERQVERVMKQKNLTTEDAISRQIWPKVTENQ